MAEKVKSAPWKYQWELRRFWALAKPHGGREFVYEILESRFGKKKLHEIARHQFLDLTKHLENGEDRCRCEEHHGQASCAQYRKMKYLQKKLGWNDRQLSGYIKKCGHVDSMRFMTTPKARGIISGMNKQTFRRTDKRQTTDGQTKDRQQTDRQKTDNRRTDKRQTSRLTDEQTTDSLKV